MPNKILQVHNNLAALRKRQNFIAVFVKILNCTTATSTFVYFTCTQLPTKVPYSRITE